MTFKPVLIESKTELIRKIYFIKHNILIQKFEITKNCTLTF